MKNFKLGLFSYMSKKVMVKCAPDEKSGDSISALNAVTIQDRESPINTAKRLLSEIKSDFFDSKSFTKLDALLKEIDKDNIGNKKAIFDQMDALINTETSIISGYTSGNREELIAMRQKFDNTYNEAEAKKIAEKTDLKKGNKKLIAKEVSKNNHLDLLSNLNNDNAIDNTDRDFVNERALKRALSLASNGGTNLDEVYKRVTGVSPDWSDEDTTKTTVVQFRNSLRVSMAVIKQLGGGNAGLDSLLQGKMEAFLKEVLTEVTRNDGKPLQIYIANSEELSPFVHNILGVVGTTGIAILSHGTITTGHEKNSITTEEFIKKEDADVKGGFWNTLGSSATWVKEAFLGRRLSLTLGEERVDNYKKNITNFTKQVMGLTSTTSPNTIQDPTLKSAFETALLTTTNAGIDLVAKPEEFTKIQKALIQSYIIGEGFKNEGSNWSASIGIFMLAGIHYDTISTEALQTRPSGYNNIERKATKKDMEQQIYKDAGVNIEQKNGKWEYTIPKKIKLPGDDEAMDVIIPTVEGVTEEEKNVFNFQTPKNLHFSPEGESYILSFSDATITTETKQVKQDVENLRKEIIDLKKKDIPDLLFYVGHNKAFNPLLDLLAKQDYDGAKQWLEDTATKGEYRTVCKRLLAINTETTNISSWTTYMYGSAASRAKQEYTQKYVDRSVRTKKTINAENKFAKTLGLPDSKEGALRMEADEKYQASQASDIEGLKDKRMTIACIATPKGAAARLDTYDASVSMSNKIEMITDEAERRDVIKAIHKSVTETKGIEAELKNLNGFIKESSPKSADVTIDQYINYLVSGNIQDLGNIPGLKLVKGKGPQVFEGRAMIAGNVCINRLYGITYPSFTINSTTQTGAPVVSVDSSTVLNEVNVATTTTDGGINPIAVFANKVKKEVTPGKPTTRIDSREIQLTTENTVVDGNKVKIIIDGQVAKEVQLSELSRNQAMVVLGRGGTAEKYILTTERTAKGLDTIKEATNGGVMEKGVASAVVATGEVINTIKETK